jgi:hypothetical protein
MGSNAITNGSSKRNNVDETKLKDFKGKVLNDLGGAWSTTLVVIGDNNSRIKIEMSDNIKQVIYTYIIRRFYGNE